MLAIKKTETFSPDPITEVEQDNNITIDDIKTYQSLVFDDPKNEIDLGTENIEDMDDDDIIKKIATNKEKFADSGHYVFGCVRWTRCTRNGGWLGICDRWEEYDECPRHDHQRFDLMPMIIGPFKNALGNLTSGFTFPSGIKEIIDDLEQFMKDLQSQFDGFIGGINEGFGVVGEFITSIPDTMYGVLKTLIAGFQDLFKVLMLLMLDILRAVFSDEFLNILTPLFSWFMDPLKILIFGESGSGGIYNIGLQWMWYIVAAILLGIGLEVISISKILAG
uniref:Uncharacterized protein n=1 Tax=viral metagenome TaxID=1070528 RepID=A0A6C0FEQ3_9ZZZZ|tara:strand:- start:43238 stop:44071 length:834 start_codon:yes stop_codon:yes gene_type:complete